MTPVVCIRISFALKPLLSPGDRRYISMHKMRIMSVLFIYFILFYFILFIFFFHSKLTSKLICVRLFTEFSPMIHFTRFTSKQHYFQFSYTMNFSFCGNYQRFKWFNIKYQNDLSGLFVCRKSKSKSTKCIFSTFLLPACETGRKNATILQLLFI